MDGTRWPVERQQIWTIRVTECLNTTRMDTTAEKTKEKMEINITGHLGPVWPRIARDRCVWRPHQRLMQTIWRDLSACLHDR